MKGSWRREFDDEKNGDVWNFTRLAANEIVILWHFLVYVFLIICIYKLLVNEFSFQFFSQKLYALPFLWFLLLIIIINERLKRRFIEEVLLSLWNFRRSSRIFHGKFFDFSKYSKSQRDPAVSKVNLRQSFNLFI